MHDPQLLPALALIGVTFALSMGWFAALALVAGPKATKRSAVAPKGRGRKEPDDT